MVSVHDSTDIHYWSNISVLLTLCVLAENLPGDYAVWAASEEAKFLHGRFTWAAWDVNELSTGTIREKIDANPDYLKVGVVGL